MQEAIWKPKSSSAPRVERCRARCVVKSAFTLLGLLACAKGGCLPWAQGQLGVLGESSNSKYIIAVHT